MTELVTANASEARIARAMSLLETRQISQNQDGSFFVPSQLKKTNVMK